MTLRWVNSDKDLSLCYDIRRTVFIEEQAVPEELEIDSFDATARHLLMLSPTGEAVGTARLLLDTPQAHYCKIGRVAVLQAYRGRGFATALMREVEKAALAAGQTYLALDAQLPVIPMYEKLGYEAYGPIFDDAGIEHRKMSKTVT